MFHEKNKPAIDLTKRKNNLQQYFTMKNINMQLMSRRKSSSLNNFYEEKIKIQEGPQKNELTISFNMKKIDLY